MATTLNPPTSLGRAPATTKAPRTRELTGGPDGDPQGSMREEQAPEITPASRRVGAIGLLALRLAIGFEFAWAFLDKTFGLGYATPAAHAWIKGFSPTTGFLSGVNTGPFQALFHSMAGVVLVDWLFMLGLLSVGVGLILGVALRPAAVIGITMLLLMYAATWPFATVGGGQPTGSTNPFVDDHIVSTMGLIVIGALASLRVGVVSRRWSALSFVRTRTWLR
jgi:thiosulfate dehydrogenase [quinone] large subunit